MSTIQRICLVLTIIGAINWGLIGFFQFDLVAAIFGGTRVSSFPNHLRTSRNRRLNQPRSAI
nr:DUF378 domain-containing protein [Bacillus subtilis]WGD91322.1 DUF378 domain-containing protein [Bacillus subtilis]